MKAEIRDRYKILFIIFVSLGIYYPSIFGSVNSIDDYRMITSLINTQKTDWKGIFLPGGAVYYYRPLLVLSFFFDRFVFGCHESFMHLENILLHTANGVLAFLIVKEIQRIFRITADSYIPMFSALLFILHPINTEAVNWISGRTDVMAGLFVFLSFLIFLKKGMQNYIWCWLSAVFYLMGLFSKEIAIGLLPVIAFFLFLREKPLESIKLKRKLWLFTPFLFVTVMYYLMRTANSVYPDLGISTAAKISEGSSFLISLSGAIKAFGFYIKKLFMPLPLNFGIVEINRTLYFRFGIIALGVIAYFLFKRKLLSFLLFFSVMFFLPAIPVAVSKMTWTPLAERYLYVSSFGVCALTVLLINSMPWKKELTYISLAGLLITSAAITVNRNIIWQSNLTLFEDTVKKSPSSGAAWNEYGIALIAAGRMDEASKQFEISQQLAGNIKYRERPSMNIITLSRQNQPVEAKKTLLKLLENSSSPQISMELLQKVIFITENQVKEETSEDKQKRFHMEIISYFEELYKLEGNSFYLYKQGQYYLVLGEKEKAVEFFKKTVELSPNEYYSEPARKLAKKLESEIKN